MHPVERLVNLVALLLEARRPLTFSDIRAVLPAYQQDDVAAAKRMFERDKDVLRETGIPVELAPTDAFAVEEGYVVPKERYYLPEISFTPEEISALFVAAHSPGGDGEAELAALKLGAAGETGLGELASHAMAAGPDLAGPQLLAVAEATLGRRSVRFLYRSSTGEVGERVIDPYALVWRSGHWYVVGFDRDRDDIRSFRLSRFLSDVRDVGEGSSPPAGFDGAEYLKSGPWGIGEPVGEARVAFSPDIAWWATRGVQDASVIRKRSDGWTEVAVPGGPDDSFVAWVLSFGADAEALSPPELRERVVASLEATLAGL
jgi:proteasome accessory factor B